MIEYYNGALIYRYFGVLHDRVTITEPWYIDMLEYYMIEYYNGTLIYRYVGVLHGRVL